MEDELILTIKDWYIFENRTYGLVLIGILDDGGLVDIPVSIITKTEGRKITVTPGEGIGKQYRLLLENARDDYLKYIDRCCIENWDPENPIKLEKKLES
ncbi:MAG: hypothetical protein A2161_13750 [Candidatus Schekmanbacteria bacterium RBG_13_48_7]|uniref:Uncharacterized protein n=1 Tax=Candidatus Schekmanbacteria bacterium RBG_13_48_7 TaxID=1817878 RepID=A0A1F7RZJ4_9BACT|nr:MAG: hypothetical protein A2161_13750 [Candidatus Schekmanbacteria bacterium RBG_13_48_7]